MSPRICAVSIDLDALSCYAQIHDLRGYLPPDPDPVYSHAMPRFLELFEGLGVKATFFVVGRDAEHPIHGEILRDAAARGHELANHSYSHPYRLTHLQPHEIEAEITQGARAIEQVMPAGERVLGFRCPGYNISAAVLQALRRHDYLYDSSIFPCPPYLAARAAVIAAMALQGRSSRSLPGSPQALWAPTQPYQPSADPHQKGKGGRLWEIPMSVAPGLRLPYIGTFVNHYYPKAWLAPLTKITAQSQPILNFELHGIDLLDSADPGLSPLAPHQSDVPVCVAEKQDRLALCLRQIAKTHTFQPLRYAAQALERSQR